MVIYQISCVLAIEDCGHTADVHFFLLESSKA